MRPLDKIFTSKRTQYIQSVYIARVKDGKVLYKRNENKSLSPASVTKLITSAALLHYLKPTDTLKTTIGHTGKLNNGVILGDLVIEGGGDPSFVSETLWGLSADLSHMGIRKVEGNIVINNNLFSGKMRDQMRLAGLNSSINSYDSPVTAFGVNYNTLAIAVYPGSRPGVRARANLDPYPINGVVIDNRLRTVSAKEKSRYRIVRVSMKDGRSKIILTGQVSINDPLKKHYRSTYDPILTSGEILRAFLNKHNITVKGRVLLGERSNMKPILEVPSKPLVEIIRDLNFYSNNYIADVLVKRLGAIDLDNPYAPLQNEGSYDNGLKAISEFLLKEVKIPAPFNIISGSGLTSENRLTAYQVSKLLLYMANRWDIFPDFLSSLPTSGENGTLEKRFNSGITSKLQGKIRAKTGTLTQPYSVSSIAGYAHHKIHGLIVFSIIQNGLKGKKQPGILDLQEKQELALLKLSQVKTITK